MLILLINVLSTWFMVGLIWIVQIVHYPLFASVGEGQFLSYQKAHVTRITYIVGPVIGIETITTLLLVMYPPAYSSSLFCWIGLALIMIILASTALLQVPSHDRLLLGYDKDIHGELVRSNWIRTIAWSARGVVTAMLLFQNMTS